MSSSIRELVAKLEASYAERRNRYRDEPPDPEDAVASALIKQLVELVETLDRRTAAICRRLQIPE